MILVNIMISVNLMVLQTLKLLAYGWLNFCNNGNNITTTILSTAKLLRGKTFMITRQNFYSLENFRGLPVVIYLPPFHTKAYPGKHLRLSILIPKCL